MLNYQPSRRTFNRLAALTRGFACMVTAVFISVFPSGASAQTYPWCAEYAGRDFGGTNCGFSNEQQCQATISGIGGYCHENLWYQKPTVVESAAPRRKHRKHRKTSEQ